MRLTRVAAAGLFAAAAWLLSVGCGGGGGRTWQCQAPGSTSDDGGAAAAPDYLTEIGCLADFQALASQPLDATLPGARSGKIVLDQYDNDALYFQNSNEFEIHHEFASKHLSGPAHPIVPGLAEFNANQYTSIDRRFLLGALTHYEGPDIWALEIAPYDTASVEMIRKLFDSVKRHTFIGDKLAFHPTSEAVEAVAARLPASVAIATTAQIFAKIDYQPLNTGETIGQLRFVASANIASAYVGFRDVVVLDATPNDISVTAGMISGEFQTPLSHINVLARNRGTPNMGLRNAFNDPALRALDGKWVRLVVGAFEYSITEVTMADADAWWETHAPPPRQVPSMDLSVTDLRDIEYNVIETAGMTMRESIDIAVRGFGAKCAGYSVLRNTPGVPTRKAFCIPVFFYDQFMKQNGFYARVEAMRADPEFRDKPAVRDAALAKLRADLLVAPIDAGFQALLKTKLDTDYPGQTMRFRSSTNAEDLDGFPCAGCYDSHTGDPADWTVDVATCNTDGNNNCGVLQAIRKTWATVWNLRTFEEREYHRIDHTGVGMALLVHHNFANEEANGVAVTANIFDTSGLVPGFYINVQWGGGAEVVHPPPGITSDEFIYQFTYPGQPIIFVSHSNLVLPGQTVLSPAQTYELGSALDLIHRRFSPAFGPLAGNNGWYAMDVEFKFDDEDSPGETPKLIVKQARPYPGPKK
jgi:pyruvate, water dikinase